MQITLDRDELLKPLAVVAGVVERRQTLPILSYALMRQGDNGITLTGTDLEVEVVVKVSGQEAPSASMTIPARKLLDICRALPEKSSIHIKKEGDKAVLRAGKSRFTLLTLPPDDFPSIETTQWELELKLPQKEIKGLLERTHFCMAQQDVRYYLNGLLLEFEGKRLRAVATDGHRMAISEMDVPRDSKDLRQMIIPRKGVHEIIRLLDDAEDDIELRVGTNHLQAQTNRLTFTTKLIDGRFPDYNKVIPAEQTKKIKLDRETFREAMNRAAILSNEKYRGVRLSLSKQNLGITAHNPEQEEAHEEVPIEYNDEAMEIGFNVNYVIEAVSAISTDDITLTLNDPNSSCTIFSPADKATRYIIMPMRL